MEQRETYTVKLENFEGPLEFLLHLVQKDEIDIYDIRLQKVTDQFIEEMKSSDIDSGAEFIGTLASLLLLKSKMLLPKHEQISESEDEEVDPHFNIIHQLIDYCRFKNAGKDLVKMEYEQQAHFHRGISGDSSVKLPLGIEHLSLDDLAFLFQDIVSKAEAQHGHLQEENFRVSDKIKMVRKFLHNMGQIPFEAIFQKGRSKEELIVTFLALLELMKLGEACVVKDSATQRTLIISRALLEETHE